jgi:iron-sulfur cluster assembly protein
MESLLAITDKAWSRIAEVFKNDENSNGKILRIKVIGGGCSGLSYKMEFDDLGANDKVLTNESIKVAIDPKSAIYLSGTTLDFSDGLEGKGFQFKNPNAANTCGCGESFSV